MNVVSPHLEVLPEAQQKLWPLLGVTSSQFTLYGGTALSLRVGGRRSIDFDFFTDGPIHADILVKSYPFLIGARLLARGKSDATFSTNGPEPIKISFFGDLKFGRVDEPSKFSDNGVVVAGLLDLAAQKAKVVQQRAEAKDYIDICTLLRSGISLERAIGAAKTLYPEFNPAITLKALTFYDDGDLDSIAPDVRNELTRAASNFRHVELVPKIAASLSVKGVRSLGAFEIPPIAHETEFRSIDIEPEL